MDPTTTGTHGGVIVTVVIPMLTAVLAIAPIIFTLVVTARGHVGKTGGAPKYVPTTDCPGACTAWRNAQLALCSAERTADVDKQILDNARNNETQALILYLAAIAFLLVVNLYGLPSLSTIANIALAAAAINWFLAIKQRIDAENAWRDALAAVDSAASTVQDAAANVLANCSDEDAQACLSNPPC